jgi:hypothetical protein
MPNRLSWTALCLFAAVLCASSGCLFARHSTNVVREKETPRAVRFESDQARGLFEAQVAELKSHKEATNGKVFFVPFIVWYSRMDVLSDNAIYNDQALACDLNGDGLISVQEAFAYSEKMKEKAEQLAKQKAAEESKVAAKPLDGGLPPGAKAVNLK